MVATRSSKSIAAIASERGDKGGGFGLVKGGTSAGLGSSGMQWLCWVDVVGRMECERDGLDE
jgi:hypothetical protein